MRFLKKLTDLQTNQPVRIQVNGTMLVGIPEQGIPLADHYICAPMSSKRKQILMDSYKRKIPDQLLEIFELANGCNLFLRCAEFGGGKFKVPMAQLSVYGVPGDSISVEGIEPFNISVEDLDRPVNTPDTWLKIGSYRDFCQVRLTEYDLFADVESGKVHSVIRKAPRCQIEQTWNTIDSCLCDLFDLIQSYTA